MNPAARDVLAERRRQIEAEGWTPEHDDKHVSGHLVQAARCYLLHGRGGLAPMQTAPVVWPWDARWWKPTGRRRDLVKAAALILAEIERMDRMETQQ